MKKTNNILVDICWTLFSSNTTFDFLDFIIHNQHYSRIRKFYSSWFGRRFNLLIYKLFHYDCQRTQCLRFLRGFTHQQLHTLAEQFYTEYLLPRRIQPVWKLLDGKDVILVSGTLDVIARTVASHIGAKAYYASELLYNDDICIGKYHDFLLTKRNLLHLYSDFQIITDNITDIDLIRHAQHATIITYNNTKHWEALLSANQSITFIHGTQSRY